MVEDDLDAWAMIEAVLSETTVPAKTLDEDEICPAYADMRAAQLSGNDLLEYVSLSLSLFLSIHPLAFSICLRVLRCRSLTLDSSAPSTPAASTSLNVVTHVHVCIHTACKNRTIRLWDDDAFAVCFYVCLSGGSVGLWCRLCVSLFFCCLSC